MISFPYSVEDAWEKGWRHDENPQWGWREEPNRKRDWKVGVEKVDARVSGDVERTIFNVAESDSPDFIWEDLET